METNHVLYLSINDFLPVLRQTVQEQVEISLKKDLQEKFLSIKETRKLFVPAVSRPTLDKWDRTGSLRKHYIGGSIYYKYSEVIAAAQTYIRHKRSLKDKPDAKEQVGANSEATQSEPILSRSELGAGLQQR